MSVRPIEYQTSLLNSVNEAKTKHIDYHKLKDNSQFIQNELQNQVKRNQQIVINTEQCSSKKVNDNKKERSRDKEEKNKKKNDNVDKFKKVKGQNLDIFI